MHRANLHNMTSFLTLEYAIPTTSSHACYVQQLRAVDHVVVCKERLAIITGAVRESLANDEED